MATKLNPRQTKDMFFRGLLWGAALLSVAVLVVIVGYIFFKGITYINLDVIFGDYSPEGGGGGFQ